MYPEIPECRLPRNFWCVVFCLSLLFTSPTIIVFLQSFRMRWLHVAIFESPSSPWLLLVQTDSRTGRIRFSTCDMHWWLNVTDERVVWTYTRGATVTLLNIIISVEGDIFIKKTQLQKTNKPWHRNYNTPRHLYNVSAAAAAAATNAYFYIARISVTMSI